VSSRVQTVEATRTRWPWILARVLLSGALLAWALHATPLTHIADTLRRTDLPLLAGGLALSLAARLAAAERNLAVSRALGLPLRRWQTIETLFISNFYALLSPGPVLSGVVTVYRYNRFGASVKGSVGALLASRGFECAGTLALALIGLVVDRARFSAAQRTLAVEIALGVLLTAVLGCVLLRQFSGRLAHRSLQRARRMGVAAAWPALLQAGLTAAALAVLARAVAVELPLASALWIAAAVYVAVLLPISVIGLGVREVTLIHCLALFGVPASAALAISVLLFLDPLLNALIGGVLQAHAFGRLAPRRAGEDTPGG
jgi:uncharacterized membrane protein YbhN (UPF0104 family)